MAQTTTTTSKRFQLNISDGVKSFFIAVLTPVFAIMLSSLNAGSLIFDWHLIATSAAAATIAYITKNFFDSAKIVVNNPPEATIKAVQEGDAKVSIIAK